MSEPGMQYFKQSPPDHADVFRLEQQLNAARADREALRTENAKLRKALKRLVEVDDISFCDGSYELAIDAGRAALAQPEDGK
jgi:phosphoribosylaminoimidazole-succinocarboxamide synthase